MTSNPPPLSGMGVITGGHQTLDGGGNGQRLAGLAISFFEALEELRRPANGKRGRTCSSVRLKAHDLATVHLRAESGDGTTKIGDSSIWPRPSSSWISKEGSVYWYNR